jgi:hypothetical protein
MISNQVKMKNTSILTTSHKRKIIRTICLSVKNSTKFGTVNKV